MQVSFLATCMLCNEKGRCDALDALYYRQLRCDQARTTAYVTAFQVLRPETGWRWRVTRSNWPKRLGGVMAIANYATRCTMTALCVCFVALWLRSPVCQPRDVFVSFVSPENDTERVRKERAEICLTFRDDAANCATACLPRQRLRLQARQARQRHRPTENVQSIGWCRHVLC
jgi:hypothetical protein